MHLMNTHTGTVQTREEWRQDMISMPLHEWHGYADDEDFEANFPHDDKVMSWDFHLVEVEQNDQGDWVEV